jgi:hypothetical protein
MNEETLLEGTYVAIGLLPLFRLNHYLLGRNFPAMNGDTRDLLAVAFSGFLLHVLIEEFDLNPRKSRQQITIHIPVDVYECRGQCGYQQLGIAHELMH